ncbi:MAG: DUF3488 domain-containing transglutaminase family protein [Enterobacterales bacterium]|nr:DUF3488 domain-containing transglutaminase family protein [Enterobacterales bacterium]
MRDQALFPGINRRGVIELILVAQVAVLLPLFQYLPVWVAAICLVVIAYRFVIHRFDKPLPGRLISGIIGLLGGAMIYLEFRTFSGRDAGVSLIVLMFSLKLLEMRWYRDAALVLFLSFFIMVAHFLFSQSLMMASYMVFCLIVVFTAIQVLNRESASDELDKTLKKSAKVVLSAIPIMLILFLFFPRLSEPLWRMPSGQSATSGISDSMTPGDIANLTTFTEPAFRVKFEDGIPPSSQRYWRGLVFSEFDGLTWSRPSNVLASRYKDNYEVEFQGTPYQYEILLEPHRRNWLYALEMPVTMGSVARLTEDYTWQRRFNLTNRLTYQLTSYPESRFELELAQRQLQQSLQMPDEGNPRTREWAQALRRQVDSNEDFIAAVLRHINEQQYRYTLSPGFMELDTIDDFWLNKYRGFCEHYSGAFVFIMRAAGIPARVVTGYQGGEMNPYGDYMIVRQSDAHAWTEVWLEGRGWVRYDPTAAIHPSRVEVDLSRSWLQREALFGDEAPSDWSEYTPSAIFKMQLIWDSINSYWQEEIIAYSAEQQYELLKDMGLEEMDMSDLAYFVLSFVFVAMLVTTLVMMRNRVKLDPVAREYRLLQQKLARQNFTKKPLEGPMDYLARIKLSDQQLAKRLQPIFKLYVQLRYQPKAQSNHKLMHDFKQRVRAL